MLLKYTDLSYLTDDNANEFINKHEQEILYIAGQYQAMYPLGPDDDQDERDDLICCAVVLYMLYGTDEDVPDVKFDSSEAEINVLKENEFIINLLALIKVMLILQQLEEKNLVVGEIEKDGIRRFKVTETGKAIVTGV